MHNLKYNEEIIGNEINTIDFFLTIFPATYIVYVITTNQSKTKNIFCYIVMHTYWNDKECWLKLTKNSIF
jgi:hypothetical protein